MTEESSTRLRSSILGCALGACIGDALGMPLEFSPRRSADRFVRGMAPGRLPAGSFTDDTEMALALCESLIETRPLDPVDLVIRYLAWYRTGPSDVGLQTSSVLARVGRGEPWASAVEGVMAHRPDSAGNGSLMRCWPIALAHHDDLAGLLAGSALQSKITHPHPDCVQACQLVNATLFYLFKGWPADEALQEASRVVVPGGGLLEVLRNAPFRNREQLTNSGWVLHTLESAAWGLLTTDSFEEALVQVVNLGGDADTAGAVTGALAGALYGMEGIPQAWIETLRGEWPVRSGRFIRSSEIQKFALRLACLS